MRRCDKVLDILYREGCIPCSSLTKALVRAYPYQSRSTNGQWGLTLELMRQSEIQGQSQMRVLPFWFGGPKTPTKNRWMGKSTGKTQLKTTLKTKRAGPTGGGDPHSVVPHLGGVPGVSGGLAPQEGRRPLGSL